MKTDGIFDYRCVEIPARYNQTINLIFQGDEHQNSPNFARKKWEQDNEELKQLSKKEDVYYIKTGDIFEALSTSERRYFVGGGFHESNVSRWAEEYKREIDQYVKENSHLIGKTLAVFGGNHYFEFYDGTTSDQALAQRLKAPYIGCSGYVILTLKIDKHHSHVVKIFVHHGKGSGRRAGSTFNALEDAASYFRDADIICMGHDHKAGAMTLPSIECSMGRGGRWKIVETPKIIGRSGSYLKAYEPGVPSYAVDAMMRPSTLGYLHVTITPRRHAYSEKGIDDRWVQLKAII